MGSCFGKCACSCCDCLTVRQAAAFGGSWFRSSPAAASVRPQGFGLRRQSSNIELEQLCNDFEPIETSTVRLQLVPSTVSSWIQFKDVSRQFVYSTSRSYNQLDESQHQQQELSESQARSNRFFANYSSNELPIIEQLTRRTLELPGEEFDVGLGARNLQSTCFLSPRRLRELNCDRASTGDGGSSTGDLIWEHEVNEDLEDGLDHRSSPGKTLSHQEDDLEWDDFEPDQSVHEDD